MQDLTASLPLASPTETEGLGRWLAAHVGPGDVLLLDGPIGAGKTHLARALIRERTGMTGDIPSPTFTLVQTYPEARGEIWHADLYRLSHPDEVLELGLVDAFEDALCLVEWPDRLGPHRPPDALLLSLAADGDGRRITLTGPARWQGLFARLAEVRHA